MTHLSLLLVCITQGPRAQKHAEEILDYYSNSVKALIGRNVRQAPENEFRFVISIATIYNDTRPAERTHRCTASLISRYDAITSAHCLMNVEITGFKFLVGSRDLRQSTPFYCLWWMHFNQWAQLRNTEPRFRQNDVAFMKIIGMIPFHIPYAQIGNFENERLYNQDANIAGWGITNNGQTARILRSAIVRILSHNECMQKMNRISSTTYVVESRRLCSFAEPFVLIQSGDSGGPIIFNDEIVGINHGTFPLNENTPINHNQKINLHFGIKCYRNFIVDLLHITQGDVAIEL